MFVIKKGAKNPEAIVKLLNFNVDKQYGPNGRDMTLHNNETKNPGRYAQAAIRVTDARQNINIYLGTKQLLENPGPPLRRH